MSFSRNDVVLLPIPFSDLTGRTVRPAVVIGNNSRGDLFLVPITSQPAGMDLSLGQWKSAGLNVPCGMKAQLATVEEGQVIKSIGQLAEEDRDALNAKLRDWLGLE
jgi:hypothetical protein